MPIKSDEYGLDLFSLNQMIVVEYMMIEKNMGRIFDFYFRQQEIDKSQQVKFESEENSKLDTDSLKTSFFTMGKEVNS